MQESAKEAVQSAAIRQKFAHFVYPQKGRFIHKSRLSELRTRTLAHYARRSMTKREAKRRLENLALETGHKKNYYVKRALNEFLDRNEHLLGHGPMRTIGFSILDQVPYRLNKFPS